MLPLRAVHKPRCAPWITRLLVAINIFVFVAQLLPGAWGEGWRAWGHSMAVQSSCYVSPGSCGIELPRESTLLWQPLFVSLFLHAGFLHLAFNMLFLSVFGPGVEDRLGRLNFLVFYLCCGVGATLCHVVTHLFAHDALVGASGAISGVLGAYFILQTRSWILTYIPPIFLLPIPAPLFLLVWIASQIMSQFIPSWNRVLVGSSDGNIAWMAHIGGFFIGAFWGWMVKPWWKKKAKNKS
jgi:membrane associated rhomboid family serine protease